MSITIITPSRKKALPVIDNKPSISHVDPNIKLIAGTMKSLNDDWYEEPLENTSSSCSKWPFTMSNTRPS